MKKQLIVTFFAGFFICSLQGMNTGGASARTNSLEQPQTRMSLAYFETKGHSPVEEKQNLNQNKKVINQFGADLQNELQALAEQQMVAALQGMKT